VDVRVIASTERDLERAVAEQRFREELFFRLNVVCLTLPPLRQRRAEIGELAHFFASHYATHYNKPETFLSPATLRVFSDYGWPGNVQELDAVVKRIVMLDAEHDVRDQLTRPTPHVDLGSVAVTTDLPLATPAHHTNETVETAADTKVPLKEIARQAAEGAERELILRTLQHTRWNRREAAEVLGVSYKALLYKIKRAEFDGAS